jgi:tetratricopeptide (TPR) repeat protein
LNHFQRRFEEGIAEAEMGIALDPNDPSAHLEMSWLMLYHGKPQEAIDFARMAMRLDPHYPVLSLLVIGLANFSMRRMDEAVEWFNRALTHSPNLPWIHVCLAAVYGHLGRGKEAEAALQIFYKAWPKEMPANLQRVMYYWAIKDFHMADLYAEGLLKAGLPGQPDDYYKVSAEHRLTGEQIRELVFGQTVTGIDPWYGMQWWIVRTENGEATYSDDLSESDPEIHDSAKALYFRDVAGPDVGKSWTDGGMLVEQWERRIKGQKYSVCIFRNPLGTAEKMNEYLLITDWGIYPCSRAN